ncbi:unnamed protein product [Polarella glacialis]|uniref:Potassium channel domain-containing protein n=1 Tax=Polarella glacialis TaxID=89957 RepID=A0A813KJJ3_POLGL|nr:unnamed protein product [Polarella glacialis]
MDSSLRQRPAAAKGNALPVEAARIGVLRLHPKPLLPHGRENRIPFEAEIASALLLSIYLSLAACVFCCLSGGKWTFIQGFYFCSVTLTTVGYGDFTPPASVAARLLTVAFIWNNVLIVSAVLGILGSRIEQEIVRGCDFISGSSVPVKLSNHMSVLGLFILFSAFGFSFLEGRSFLDGIYFTTVSLSTVGYGCVVPTSDKTRALTCPVLLVGVVSVGNITGFLANWLKGRWACQGWAKRRRSRIGVSLLVTATAALMGGIAISQASGEAWSLHECLYFAMMTITTVGYGDFTPVHSETTKLLAVLFIWSSVTVVAVLLGFIGEAEEALVGAALDRDKLCLGRTRCLRRFAAAYKDRGPSGHFLVFVGLQFLSSFIFAVLESWTLVDSFYFTAVTLTTVGYGDMIPASLVGKQAATLLALVGVPLTTALVSTLSCRFTQDLVHKIEELDK